MNRHDTGVRMRVVADRLQHYDPKDYTCCGIALREDGLCAHRDHHATPFNPYDLEPLPDLPEKPEMAHED